MNNETMQYKLKTVASFVEQSAQLAGVKGYLYEIQGFTLMLLAEQGPGVGAIVEIGSFMGRSTCWLARGSKRARREKVTAIDHFRGSPEHQKGQAHEVRTLVEEGTTFHTFQKNLRAADVEDYVEPLIASSAEAAAQWRRPVRLLFIDGDHSYEVSKEDFELWSPHVVPGGVIAFHDIDAWPGVTQFYYEMLKASDDYKQVLACAGLNVVQKQRKAAAG